MGPEMLFTPIKLGRLMLPNRIVMAPMTRSRAGAGNVPVAPMDTYYAQRASAGLIISEATQVSVAAQGYAFTPGLHNDDQIAGWRRVTDALHAAGGHIFVQLWHCGRMSHSAFQPGGLLPRAASAVRANAKIYVPDQGFVAAPEPQALTVAEIGSIIKDFADTAHRAVAAGFDGVELHGAHGYLLDNFLRAHTNRRTDAYGGNLDHRRRFFIEVVEAVATAIGADRTGFRIAPVSPVNDNVIGDDAQPLFEGLLDQLGTLGLAYCHVIEGHTMEARNNLPFDYATLRGRFGGKWMVNNIYDHAMAEDAVASGRADLVAIGRPFVANPDLVERWREGLPLAEIRRDVSLYGGQGTKGYTDYPVAER